VWLLAARRGFQPPNIHLKKHSYFFPFERFYTMTNQKLIRNRGYLPHLESINESYFITFRLTGSIPWKVLKKLEQEKQLILDTARFQNRNLSPSEVYRLRELEFKEIDRYLDQGIGDCWLAVPSIAELVVNALKFFNDDRYHLYAWCVMPNHVHTVVEPYGKYHLKNILHSWKSYTSTEANLILEREGRFWQREYYDHLIRDREELNFYINYTLMNPVNAGLCVCWQDWKWSGKF
jgi:REP element-mobilizing transposase RayT